MRRFFCFHIKTLEKKHLVSRAVRYPVYPDPCFTVAGISKESFSIPRMRGEAGEGPSLMLHMSN